MRLSWSAVIGSQVARNALLAFSGQFLSRILGVVITVILFRAYPPEVMGIYGLMLSYLSLGILAQQLGHNQALVRLTIEGRSSEIERVIFYRLTISVLCILVGVGGITCQTSSPFAPFGNEALLLVLVLLCNALSFDWQIRADQRFGALAMITVQGQVVSLFFAGLGWLSGSLLVLVLVQLGFSLCLTLGCTIAVGRQRFFEIVTGAIRHAVRPMVPLKLVLHSNVGYSVLTFVAILLSNFEMLLGGLFLSPKELGDLSAITRLGMIAFAFQSALMDVIYSNILASGQDRGKVNVWLNLVIGGLAMAIILVMPETIVHILFGSAFLHLRHEVQIYAVSLLSSSCFNIVLLSAYLRAVEIGERGGSILYLLLGFAGITGVGVWFVAQYGLDGIIVFTTLKWMVMAGVLYMCFRRSPHL